MVHKVAPPSATSARSVKETNKYKDSGDCVAECSYKDTRKPSAADSDVRDQLDAGSSSSTYVASSVRGSSGFLRNAFRWLSRCLWSHEQSCDIQQTRDESDDDDKQTRDLDIEADKHSPDTQTHIEQLADRSERSNGPQTLECSVDVFETVPSENIRSVDLVETIASRSSEHLPDDYGATLPAPCTAARLADDDKSSLHQKLELFTRERHGFLDKVLTAKQTTDDPLKKLRRKRMQFSSKRHRFLEAISVRVGGGITTGNSSTRHSESDCVVSSCTFEAPPPFEIPPGNEIQLEQDRKRDKELEQEKEREQEMGLEQKLRENKERQKQMDLEILRELELEWHSQQLKQRQDEIELDEFCQMEKELEQCEAGGMGDKTSSQPSLHSDTSQWLSDDEDLVRHDSIWYLPPRIVSSSSSDDEDTDLREPIRRPRLRKRKLPRSSHMDGWFGDDAADEPEPGAASQHPPQSDPLQEDVGGPWKIDEVEPVAGAYQELELSLHHTRPFTHPTSVATHDGIDECEATVAATMSPENDETELLLAHVPLSANPLSIPAHDVDGLLQWESTVTDAAHGSDADLESEQSSPPRFVRLSPSMLYDTEEEELRPLSSTTSDSEKDSEKDSDKYSRPIIRLSPSMFGNTEEELRPLLSLTSDSETDSERDSEWDPEWDLENENSRPIVRLSPSMFDNTDEELRPLLVPTPTSSEEDLPLLFTPIPTSEEDESSEEEEQLELLSSPIATSTTTSDKAQASKCASHGSLDTLGSLSSLDSITVPVPLPPAPPLPPPAPLPCKVHAKSLGDLRTSTSMLTLLPSQKCSKSMINLPTPAAQIHPLPSGRSIQSQNVADDQGAAHGVQEEPKD